MLMLKYCAVYFYLQVVTRCLLLDLLHPISLTPDCKMTEKYFKTEKFVELNEGNVLVLVAASCGVPVGCCLCICCMQ